MASPKGKAKASPKAKGGAPSKKGMGFKAAVAAAQRNSKGKMDKKEAAAAIASAARNASPEAKRKNPNLKKVR